MPSDRNTSTHTSPTTPVTEPSRGVDDGVTAHRVPDESDPVCAHLVDDRDDIVTERREIPIYAAQPRLAVSSQVYRDDLIALGQVVDLVSPNRAITSPAVHEDHRWSPATTAGAIRRIRNLDAVAAGRHLAQSDSTAAPAWLR